MSTAINVSPEQLKVSRERAQEAGVADLIDFRELDYRKLRASSTAWSRSG